MKTADSAKKEPTNLVQRMAQASGDTPASLAKLRTVDGGAVALLATPHPNLENKIVLRFPAPSGRTPWAREGETNAGGRLGSAVTRDGVPKPRVAPADVQSDLFDKAC